MRLLGKRKKFFKRLIEMIRPFPEAWRDFINDRSSYYPLLDRKIRRRFERDIKILLSEVNIKYKSGKNEKEIPLELLYERQ